MPKAASPCSSRSALPWVLTSHRQEEIPAVATHVRVLERGRLTAARRRVRAARHRAGAGAATRSRDDPCAAPAPVAVPTRDRVALTLTKVAVYRAGSAVLRDLSLGFSGRVLGRAWAEWQRQIELHATAVRRSRRRQLAAR